MSLQLLMTDNTRSETPVDSRAAVKAMMSQLDACNQQEAARIVRRVSRCKGNPGNKDLEKMAQ